MTEPGTDPERRDATADTEPDEGWPVVEPVAVTDMDRIPSSIWGGSTGVGPPTPATTMLDGEAGGQGSSPTVAWTDPATSEATADWSSSAPPGARRGDEPQPAGTGDRYRSLGFHQGGGIGQVWRVRDTLLNRQIAMKELREERTRDPRLTRRFLREAQVTAQLQHPNIVPVHDLSQGPDGRYFYTMKFVEGETLHQAIRAYHLARKRGEARPLEFRELIQAVVSVARALAYAHARGVLHRDLKPQNVVLGHFGEVFLLDWGLARLRKPEPDDLADADVATSASLVPTVGPDAPADQTDAAAILGTLPYMPPEQAWGRNDLVGRRSDVFGLGAILYEVLTATAPLAGARSFEDYARLIDEGIRPPRTVVPATPRPLEAICLKALAREPDDRYPTADAFADDLLRWLADEPVAACPEPWGERLGRWGRRHRARLVPAAAALLLACVALAVAVYVVDGERASARAAEGRASHFAAESQQALARASASYITTIQALTDLNNLAAREIAHVPGFTAMRRKVLELNRQYLEEVVKGQNAAAGRAELIRTLRELALIARITHQYDEALALYDRALALRRAQAIPNDFVLAQIEYDLAVLQSGRGHLAEAEAADRRALAILDALLRSRPDTPHALRLRAIVRGHLGSNLRRLGRAEAALEQFALADAFWTGEDAAGSGRDGPDQGFRWVYLANWGQALRDAGRLEESEHVLARAAAMLDAAVAASPGDNDRRMLRTAIAIQRGRTLLALGPDRADEAEGILTAAEREAAALATDYPEMLNYQDYRASALAARAEAREALGRPDEARRDREAARALTEELLARSPDEVEYRSHAARVLLGMAAAAVGRGDPDAADLLREATEHHRLATARNDRDPDDRASLERLARLRAALGSKEVTP